MEGSSTCFSKGDSAKIAFRERYLRRLVPLLSRVQQRSAAERYEAVKKAADMSLARTAGKACWSRALCSRKLHELRHGHLDLKRKSLQAGPRQKRRGFCWPAHQIAGPSDVLIMRGRLQRSNRRRRVLARIKQQYRKSLNDQLALRVMQSHVTSNMTVDVAKLASLSEIIPGKPLHLGFPKLLDEAAHYILSLQMQVDALTSLCKSLIAPQSK